MNLRIPKVFKSMFVLMLAVSLTFTNYVHGEELSTEKTPIMGQALSTKEQMVKYFQLYNSERASEYINNFAAIVIEEASAEGVRADVAFVQMMKETNFLKFTGVVKEVQNNFAGLGATGGTEPGLSFPDIRTGIRAVIQHLKAYASKEDLKLPLVDPRFKYVTRGSAPYVEWLGINENPNKQGWASDKNYGYDIVNRVNTIKGIRFANSTGFTIVLDPGHGGSDPGSIKKDGTGKEYNEKTLNLSLAKKLGDRLTALGHTVVYTRSPYADTFVSLEERAKFANEINANLFLSIHHDSTDSSPTIGGTSTHFSSYRLDIDNKDIYVLYNGVKYKFLREGDKGFYIDFNGQEKFVSIEESTAYDSTPSSVAVQSGKLAAKLAEAISSLGLNNRGAIDHNLYVTRKTNMVSLLIESGFMSNPAELSKLADENYQRQMANKVAETINIYVYENMKTVDELYKAAYDATLKAQTTNTQRDMTDARALVDLVYKLLPKELKSLAETLSSMLDKLQHPLLVKTVDAINKAQTSSRQADVNAARALILDMPEVWRNAYSSAIDAAQNKVIANALEAIKKAQVSGVLVDKAMATALYNELLTITNNDAVKVWAQTVLKAEMDKLTIKN
jgi:N-acetylmuramoyl-L-alanine amidase